MHTGHISQKGGNLGSIGKLVKNKKVYQRGYNNLSHRNYYIRAGQRGQGFGAVFSGLARFLIPLIRSGYHALKDETLSAGKDIINELKDKSIDNIVRKRGREAIQNLKTKAVNKIDSVMSGSGRKRRKKSTKTIKRRHTKIKVQITPSIKRLQDGKGKIKNISSSKNRKKTKKLSIKDIFG